MTSFPCSINGCKKVYASWPKLVAHQQSHREERSEPKRNIRIDLKCNQTSKFLCEEAPSESIIPTRPKRSVTLEAPPPPAEDCVVEAKRSDVEPKAPRKKRVQIEHAESEVGKTVETTETPKPPNRKTVQVVEVQTPETPKPPKRKTVQTVETPKTPKQKRPKQQSESKI